MGLCSVGERRRDLAVLEKGDGLSVLERDDEVLESRRKLMGSCSLVERRWDFATLEKGDENLQCWRKEMTRNEMELCCLVDRRSTLQSWREEMMS
jgi:hypothetical protein